MDDYDQMLLVLRQLNEAPLPAPPIASRPQPGPQITGLQAPQPTAPSIASLLPAAGPPANPTLVNQEQWKNQTAAVKNQSGPTTMGAGGGPSGTPRPPTPTGQQPEITPPPTIPATQSAVPNTRDAAAQPPTPQAATAMNMSQDPSAATPNNPFAETNEAVWKMTWKDFEYLMEYEKRRGS